MGRDYNQRILNFYRNLEEVFLGYWTRTLNEFFGAVYDFGRAINGKDPINKLERLSKK